MRDLPLAGSDKSFGFPCDNCGVMRGEYQSSQIRR
jgi:hypothetical protein